jgi:hypothetical protein
LGSIKKELGKLDSVMMVNEKLKNQLDRAIAQAAADKVCGIECTIYCLVSKMEHE